LQRFFFRFEKTVALVVRHSHMFKKRWSVFTVFNKSTGFTTKKYTHSCK